MFAFQSTPIKLFDQTKETTFIITLKKIHIIGGNHKWVVWDVKDRFCNFGIIIPNGLSKLYKGFANWFSTICEKFAYKF